MAGGVVVNLNPIYTADELEFAFKDAGLTGLITLIVWYRLSSPWSSLRFQWLWLPVWRISCRAESSTDEELGLEPGWLNFPRSLKLTDAGHLPG